MDTTKPLRDNCPHQNVAAFLSILWCDLLIFGVCMALAIYFRKRPEYHRRLVFLASCQLMQATFVGFHHLGHHSLFFPALDLVVAGIVRDLIVDAEKQRAANDFCSWYARPLSADKSDFVPLSVFNARFYIRVRCFDEPS
jgi:hypothetical protein